LFQLKLGLSQALAGEAELFFREEDVQISGGDIEPEVICNLQGIELGCRQVEATDLDIIVDPVAGEQGDPEIKAIAVEPDASVIERVGGRVNGTSELHPPANCTVKRRQAAESGLFEAEFGSADLVLGLFDGQAVLLCVFDAAFKGPGLLGLQR